ncbi:MAG TPA: hypothetical protein VHT91_29835 [Kofleriaceae bacterium]|nr:hypothetical protein [Kofleriaceae bacterium]
MLVEQRQQIEALLALARQQLTDQRRVHAATSHRGSAHGCEQICERRIDARGGDDQQRTDIAERQPEPGVQLLDRRAARRREPLHHGLDGALQLALIELCRLAGARRSPLCEHRVYIRGRWTQLELLQAAELQLGAEPDPLDLGIEPVARKQRIHDTLLSVIA